VRDNQRRSRERRKELIDDLQKRLREYEQKEMQATVAIQLAAQNVARENSRLRELLANKGISNQEIEQFLHTQPQTEPNLASQHWTKHGQSGSHALQTLESHKINSNTNHMQSSKKGPYSSIGQQPCNELRSFDANETISNASDTSSKMMRTQASTLNLIVKGSEHLQHMTMTPGQNTTRAETTPVYQENRSTWNVSNIISTVDDGNQNHLVSHSLYPSPQDSASCKSIVEQATLDMSCETAATIIAGMRGTGDEEGARIDLGCASASRECRVSNTKVFQVMEME
jgi:hypothetical protein